MNSRIGCLIIAAATAISGAAWGVELTLYPAAAERTEKYRLVPAPTEQKDEDAAPLYAKAVQLLPKYSPVEQISKWRAMPIDKLPLDQVAATLQMFKPSLQMVEQAAQCKQCNWPGVPPNLQESRRLALALSLQAGLLTAQGQYEQAIGAVRTGFAMARHIAESPDAIQSLVGIAIAAVMCQQVERNIQAPGAPNLYWALRDLPKPLVDLTEQMKFEDQDVKQKIRLLMNRLDRHVAVLQCIEAIRHFAATHSGKLPDSLGSITGMVLPEDPVTRKSFVYTLSGTTAILEGPMAKGGTEKDAVRYEMTLRQ